MQAPLAEVVAHVLFRHAPGGGKLRLFGCIRRSVALAQYHTAGPPRLDELRDLDFDVVDDNVAARLGVKRAWLIGSAGLARPNESERRTS